MTAILKRAICAACVLIALVTHSGQEQPNILWIVSEDINPHLGCYGDTNAVTPNIDRLATGGLRYTRCWSTAPVCAPARTALITGMYPTSLGAEHMRSEVSIPEFMRLYPQLLTEAGYYCVNNSKEDYNVTRRGKVWAESSPRAHYRNRAPGQPFFAAFNMETTHESQIRSKPHTLKHDPQHIRVPAYHPDVPAVRRDWAQYYDKLTEMDQIVGRHLRELDELGLSEETIVFFYGDNGSGMPRSKRWLYNSGLNVPLIVRVPTKWRHLAPPGYEAGKTSDRLVSFVDFAPTLLSIAGRKPPGWMQGVAFMGAHIGPARKYNFGLRGRMDERYDLLRSATDGKYVYIRNFMPHLIYGQHIDYMFQTPTTQVWKRLFDEGKLSPPRDAFWRPKPVEELYDLSNDPDEVQNLAQSRPHSTTLSKLREVLRQHMLETRDSGLVPEAENHSRAGHSTIFEMARDEENYPISQMLEMAEKATSLQPEVLPDLEKGLSHPDSAVRYWAAMGLFMRGSNAVNASSAVLTRALADKSPSVRVAAAQALAMYGPQREFQPALAVLEKHLSPAQNGPYISLVSLSAVEALGSKAKPLLETLVTMPVEDPGAPARANTWVPKFVTDLTNALAGARE